MRGIKKFSWKGNAQNKILLPVTYKSKKNIKGIVNLHISKIVMDQQGKAFFAQCIISRALRFVYLPSSYLKLG